MAPFPTPRSTNNRKRGAQDNASATPEKKQRVYTEYDYQRLGIKEIQRRLRLDDDEHEHLHQYLRTEMEAYNLLGTAKLWRGDCGDDHDIATVKAVIHNYKTLVLAKMTHYTAPEDLDRLLWYKATYVNQIAKHAKSTAQKKREKKESKGHSGGPQQPVADSAAKIAAVRELDERSLDLAMKIEDERCRKEECSKRLTTVSGSWPGKYNELFAINERIEELLLEHGTVQETRLPLVEQLTGKEMSDLLVLRNQKYGIDTSPTQ